MSNQPVVLKAIETKYLPCTKHRGSRVKAVACHRENNVTVDWDYALNSEANHRVAAQMLLQKMGWKCNRLIQGATCKGYCFVMEND